MSTEDYVIRTTDKIRDLILEKNRKYGDSALNPKRVFSQASIDEQIKVRLDDKISRLQSNQLDDDEDVILDMIGYLILLLVYRQIEEEAENPLNSIQIHQQDFSNKGSASNFFDGFYNDRFKNVK